MRTNFGEKVFLTNNLSFLFTFLALVFSFNLTIAANKIIVNNLRTEYKQNPIGINSKIPRLSWEIITEQRNFIQSAYQIKAAKSIAELESDKNLIWNSGKIISDRSNQIEYKGNNLKSSERIFWQVKIWGIDGSQSQWSDPAFWEMGLINKSDWKAKWIEQSEKDNLKNSTACPMFRKEINLKKGIKSAKAYVTSHGLYELRINGKKISEQLFTPGWTSYNARLQYQTYDVTQNLISGENSLGAILANGWYKGPMKWDYTPNNYGSKLGLLLQIEITFEDGSTKTIISDESWKYSTGPILMSEIYDGEIYDARLEKSGWDNNNYDDNSWEKVSVANYGYENLIASEGPEVKVTQTIRPINKFVTPNGELVFDFGQNMVGWIQIKLNGNAGEKITLKHGEVLDQDGNLYLANLRKAKQIVEYTFKGEKEEIYEPRFTFQGFRYVAVTDYKGEIALNDLVGKVIHSDMTPTGNFECSDSLINQLQKNIQWGLRGNFLDVPTDCPQRDERLGWTGDAQVFAPTACFNMDAASFYSKWMKDFIPDQLSDGRIPHVIPNILPNEGGAAGWADAGIIVPWTVYLNYGDKRILETQYESMKKWIEYLKTRAGDSFLWNTAVGYGDWLAFATNRSDYPGATTDKDLIGTAYYYYSTSLMNKIAFVLGKNKDAEEFSLLMTKIKNAFQKEFITSSGRIASNTQTAYLLALAFDLVPENSKNETAKRLANDVKNFGHLTSGFLGASHIAKVLTDFGYEDLAFKLLFRKEYPSWLYPVTKGATTIWERWDGIKTDGTFQSEGMNSFNHYAYGAIGKWLYSDVAGIDLDENIPGFKNIIVNPHTNENLKFAKAEFNSIYGKIKSSWKNVDNIFKLELEIPANTTADVFLPTDKKENILESGKSLNEILGINSVKVESGKIVLHIGSGKYHFEVK
ncbi:MAG: family 78 glycoside hydrolase catalytic domain [Ignavibacteriae bacterium]|nr:family 78 glycoside hydrolase catalytic domain [Ignavibacteriota bacterium]